MKNARRRTKRLEGRRPPPPGSAEPFLVICPPDELPDEHLAKLKAAGRRTAALCVPKVPETPDEIAAWERSCSTYMAWLLAHGKRIAEGGTESYGDLIRRAHRAAWAGDPMPDV